MVPGNMDAELKFAELCIGLLITGLFPIRNQKGKKPLGFFP
jgi:hypothetical protein